MTSASRLELAKALLDVPHVGWAALKVDGGIEILRRNGQQARISLTEAASCNGKAAHFEWLAATPSLETQAFSCLNQFDLATGPEDDSFIVPALVDYFSNPASPDMVFVPDDHSDFASGYAGNHGGFSREEMLVPVLTKDVDLTRGIHPTSDLLRAMGVKK